MPLASSFRSPLFCCTSLLKAKFYDQPVIHVGSAFYIFGGYADDSDTDVIARLDARTYVWTQSGTMNNARSDHNVIYVDSAFLVIGGTGKLSTEKCQLSGNTMSCSTQEPTLDNYTAWPELILVEDDYCQELPSQ